MNLQRLAELINAKWPETAVLFGSGLVLKRNCETFHLSDTDSQNAKFIVWCLDRLEELGTSPTLRHSMNYAAFECVIEFPSFNGTGTTRAEACALALLQALEGE